MTATFRVVVADDSPDDRADVRRQLLRGSERRYAFVEAETADATVRAVLDDPRGPPACLVLDYHLPDADAPEVLAALARPEGGCACPVVVLTGGDGRLAGGAVLRAGAQDFLGKQDMTAESLTRAVENAVERHRMEQELREREAALAEADRRKDEFLATLAHELRNPLAPLRNGLAILRRGGATDDAAARAQAMMERQLSHLVRLVDDLLDVSRISRGMVKLEPQRVSLATILEHAVETTGPLVDAGGHMLTVRTPDAPVFVHGDLTRLAQVVSNLLNNAAKYTPRGGHIELWAGIERPEPGAPPWAVVRVTDDGTGISADMLPRVFDLFAQVDRTLDRAQGGLGIGLSLVRRLVEMHGGTIAARSEGLGRGSTFTVRLPLASAGEDGAAGEAVARPEGRAAARRVLVVDDNLDAAETLAMLLSLQGHEATTAHSGPEALEAARARRPEVVFLDIGMPGMDGYEVARRLRADPALAGTTLVALTGWGSEDDKRRSQDAGFDVHLTKPVEPTAVAEVLAGIGGRERVGSGEAATCGG